MKKLYVGIDMDSIAVEFMPRLLAQHNAKYGTIHTIADVKDWNFLATKEYIALMEAPGYFRHLRPMPGVARAMEKLLELGHEPFLLTACGEASASSKIGWMKEYLPIMDKRMFMSQSRTPKGIVPFDVIVDDAPHNLLDVQQRRPQTLLLTMDYPYNQPEDPTMAKIAPGCVVRCGSYQEPERFWSNVVNAIQFEASMRSDFTTFDGRSVS